jgi:hypothetical protein
MRIHIYIYNYIYINVFYCIGYEWPEFLEPSRKSGIYPTSYVRSEGGSCHREAAAPQRSTSFGRFLVQWAPVEPIETIGIP